MFPMGHTLSEPNCARLCQSTEWCKRLSIFFFSKSCAHCHLVLLVGPISSGPRSSIVSSHILPR